MRAFGNDILRSPDKSGRGEISERGVRLPRPNCVGTRNAERGDAQNDKMRMTRNDEKERGAECHEGSA